MTVNSVRPPDENAARPAGESAAFDATDAAGTAGTSRHERTSPGRRLTSRPRTAGTMQYEQTELQPIEICTQAWKSRSRRLGSCPAVIFKALSLFQREQATLAEIDTRAVNERRIVQTAAMVSMWPRASQGRATPSRR